MSKLLPCPLCGSDRPRLVPMDGTYDCIRCDNCDARITSHNAVRDWNRRAAVAAPAASTVGERETFETWLDEREEEVIALYPRYERDLMWLVWQAARASAPQPVPAAALRAALLGLMGATDKLQEIVRNEDGYRISNGEAAMILNRALEQAHEALK